MYRTIQDFAEDWKVEIPHTLKMIMGVEDCTGNEKVHPDVRSLREIAWHITKDLSLAAFRTGLIAQNELAIIPSPGSVSLIATTFREYSQLIEDLITETWTNGALRNRVAIYGQMDTKGRILHRLIKHQVHHRGQMTVLMRFLGLKVPGTYGPSKEDWSRVGIVPSV